MRIAVYGAGSLGTVLGAYITKAKADVVLVTIDKSHRQALQQNGARLIGTVNETIPVKAISPEQMSGQYDIILLVTKQLENDRVVQSLTDYMKPDSFICTLQDGLPELKIASIVGSDRVIGCTVGWGATRKEPGVCEITSEKDVWTFTIGNLVSNTQVADKIQKLKTVLEMMGQVTIEDNFIGARWAKLLINSAFSGLATIFGYTYGQVIDNIRTRLLAQKTIEECMAIAKAARIRIEPVQGHDIEKLFSTKSKIKKIIAFGLIPTAVQKHRSIKPGMLQDIEKSIPCEIDAINGATCSFARRYAVASPYNDKIVEIIHDIEEGKSQPCIENLQRFRNIK